MTMTLAEFRAAGTDCADLGGALSDALWSEKGYIAIGRIYPGDLWIERMPDNWPFNSDAAGKWYLLIYRDDWLSDNLSELEERLYNFGVDEGYFDARGDRFFINQQSVERYAKELKQIEAIASIGAENRHDAPRHDAARNSAPERANIPATSVEIAQQRQHDPSGSEPMLMQLRDENLNLRIDNRAKEIAIAQLNNRLAEDRDKFLTAMLDISYRLGAAETRVAQLEAPKEEDKDKARHSAPQPDTVPEAGTPVSPLTNERLHDAAPASDSEPKRSFFGRLFR